MGFPQGFPTKLVTNLVLVGRGRRAMGIHGLLLALLGENCAEGQGSCLLGCQSTNEADLRFLGVYIASCNDHFSALGFPWVTAMIWGFPRLSLGFPSKLVSNLVLVGRVEQLWGMLRVLLALLGENCAEGQGSCLLGCQSTTEADPNFGWYI